jgi:hypothetical protein
MEDKKAILKRFIHDNVVTLVTVMIFVLLLALLLLDRYGSLYSIRNIANINPLITSESAELVAVNVNGVIRIIKDDDGNVTEEEKKVALNDQKQSSGQSSSGSSSGGSSGSSSGGSTGGGNGGSSPSPSPSQSSSPSPSPSQSSSPSPSPSPSQTPPPVVPLAGTVLSLARTNVRVYERAWIIVGYSCKNDHTFVAQVRATAGSGNAKVRWRLGSQLLKTEELGFISSGDTRSSTAVATTNSVGNYSVTAEFLNASNTVLNSRSMNFSHSC